jgi:hypothetical protein
MTQPESPAGAEPQSRPGSGPPGQADEEHFKPVGTIFLLAIFVLTLILLWASVYVILISRGVTT